MTDTNAMLNRVKKLLALANDTPFEAEARSAAKKAQELIAKYGLDLSQATGETVEYAVLPATHPNNNGYRTKLAMVLAGNFRCKCIMIGNTVHFFGRKQDAQVAVEVFNYLYRVSRTLGAREERKARAEGRNTHGVANSYWNGFVQGLKADLDAQCKALMIVVPDDVKTEFTKKYPSCTTYKGGQRSLGFDYGAYSKGVEDGKHSMRGRKEIDLA